jgi:hypothetical protein
LFFLSVALLVPEDWDSPPLEAALEAEELSLLAFAL